MKGVAAIEFSGRETLCGILHDLDFQPIVRISRDSYGHSRNPFDWLHGK